MHIYIYMCVSIIQHINSIKQDTKLRSYILWIITISYIRIYYGTTYVHTFCVIQSMQFYLSIFIELQYNALQFVMTCPKWLYN